ncbi:MAG TPA: tetratricopeptide repeat protein [Planctomycetota bacterium]|nr:tetratricopeptide repeat protein [Planctomycetota bacterium]
MRIRVWTFAWLATAALAAGGEAALPKGHPPVKGAGSKGMEAVHKKLRDLEAACTKDPKAVEPRLELGNLYLQFGLTERAVRWLDEAVKLKPDSTGALVLAGHAHAALAQYDAAIELWTKALALDPKSKQLKGWLAEAKQAKEVHTKLAAARAGLEKTPDDGALHLQAGEALARLGEWAEARTHLAKATALLPKDAAAHRLCALILMRLGDMDKAIMELETCTKLDPENKDYRRLLDTARQTRDMHQKIREGKYTTPKSGGAPKAKTEK